MSRLFNDLLEEVSEDPVDRGKDDAEDEQDGPGAIQSGESEKIDDILLDLRQAVNKTLLDVVFKAKKAMGGEEGFKFRGPGFLSKVEDIFQSFSGGVHELYQSASSSNPVKDTRPTTEKDEDGNPVHYRD